MTDQWHFVIAAYALTVLLTGAVLWGSWRAMTRAEQGAAAVQRDRP